MNNDTQKMVDAINHELDKSCDRLDGATLSRLNKIRHDALAQAAVKKRFNFPLAGGFVAACLVVMFGFQMNTAPDTSIFNEPVDDSEIWASSESYEFLEDLEFYQWLAENEPSV